ncbi:hypothetical protein BJY01DRAFT_251123 [Aspergillus pseudoustus]|uniref:Cytochrome P450 n=1 Tax=Aspergillus pseudoustus TaxID=1810923 RepID=A0ABR4JDR8_9EURO
MLDTDFKQLPANAWEPFGNGKRSCIGRALAWQEALMIMALLMQNFTSQLCDEEYKLKIKESLTIKPDSLWATRTRERYIQGRVAGGPAGDDPVRIEQRNMRGPGPSISRGDEHPSLNACDHLTDIERLVTASTPGRILAWPVLALGLDGALLSVIPHDESPAPLNGGEFLIHRKTGGQYWYVQHCLIRVGERLTKFRIELVDEVETVGTPILIPSDKVYITALTPLGDHNFSYHDGDGTLSCGDTNSEYRFGALQRGFRVYLSDGYSESVSYLGEDGERPSRGDEWELAV